MPGWLDAPRRRSSKDGSRERPQAGASPKGATIGPRPKGGPPSGGRRLSDALVALGPDGPAGSGDYGFSPRTTETAFGQTPYQVTGRRPSQPGSRGASISTACRGARPQGPSACPPASRAADHPSAAIAGQAGRQAATDGLHPRSSRKGRKSGRGSPGAPERRPTGARGPRRGKTGKVTLLRPPASRRVSISHMELLKPALVK